MLPLALGYVTVIATAIWFLHDQLGWTYDTRFALALFGLNLLLAVPLLLRARPRPHHRRLVVEEGDAPDGDRVKVMKRPGAEVSYLRATLKAWRSH